MLTSTTDAMRTTEEFPGHSSADFLLVSDLDGTLISPVRDYDSKPAIAWFTELVRARRSLLLAYATGRHFELAVTGIRGHDLPCPDVLICDVGTRIYHRGRTTVGFAEDRDYAIALEAEFGPDMNARIRRLVERPPQIRAQEESRQGRFKTSFYVDRSIAESEVMQRVWTKLGSESERLHIVFSIDPADKRGLLDVIPAGVSKGSATTYLSRQLGLTEGQVLYAGDSGNDTDALLAGFKGILVGNAPESLRQRIRSASDRRGLGNRVYFARASYADGVVEGCRHFGFSASG